LINNYFSQQVTYEQGKALADENDMKFCEVSAKENIGIEQAFLVTTTDVLASPNFIKKTEHSHMKMKENKKGDDNKKGGCC
jgi:hypothetical protein